jgi:hypothetical protein
MDFYSSVGVSQQRGTGRTKYWVTSENGGLKFKLKVAYSNADK